MLHATPSGPLPRWPNVNPFGIIMRLLANILFAPHSRRSFPTLSLASPRVAFAGGVINFYLLQQRVVSSAIMLAFSFYLAMSQTCTRCATGRLKQTDKGHKGATGQEERPKCAPMEFMGANWLQVHKMYASWSWDGTAAEWVVRHRCWSWESWAKVGSSKFLIFEGRINIKICQKAFNGKTAKCPLGGIIHSSCHLRQWAKESLELSSKLGFTLDRLIEY